MLTQRLWMLMFVALTVATLSAACGPGGGSTGGTGGAGAQTVDVTGSEFKYDPATLNVTAGQRVTVNLKNAGTVLHTFEFKEANFIIKAETGKTASGTFTAPAAGTYQFVCNEPGHKEAGMVGQLIVK